MVKKTACIFFFVLFLFNWFGYRVLTYVLEQKAAAQMKAELDDDNYLSSELLSVKIPANMPYYTGSGTYERVDGEIEIAGRQYNYVKRRLFNDSLELLCIPNNRKTMVHTAGNEFFKLVSGFCHPSGKKNGTPFATGKNLPTEYWQNTNVWAFRAFVPSLKHIYPHYLCHAPKLLRAPKEQPPDLNSKWLMV